MTQPVVTLGGIVSEPNAKLTILMSYYFKSLDYHLGVGDDSQYSFTVDLTGENPVEAMTNSVRNLLSGHFDDIIVDISLEPDTTTYTFKINVSDNGFTYAFNTTLDAVEPDFNQFQDIERTAL